MAAAKVTGPSGRTGSGAGAGLTMPPVPLADKGMVERMSCAPTIPADEAAPEGTAPFGADGVGAMSVKRTSGDLSLAGPAAFAQVADGVSGVVREGGTASAAATGTDVAGRTAPSCTAVSALSGAGRCACCTAKAAGTPALAVAQGLGVVSGGGSAAGRGGCGGATVIATSEGSGKAVAGSGDGSGRALAATPLSRDSSGTGVSASMTSKLASPASTPESNPARAGRRAAATGETEPGVMPGVIITRLPTSADGAG